MFKYPTLDDARIVFPKLRDALRGRDVPLDQATHAGYVTIGFGLSLTPGQPPEPGVIALSHADLADQLEIALHAGEGASAQATFPWELFIPIILDAVKRWTERRRTGAQGTAG